MKNQIITILLILMFQNLYSQSIPAEWTALLYNLPANATIEEIINKAKTIGPARLIDETNGYAAHLDSPGVSIANPDDVILNITSGVARFDGQKLSANQTIIISIQYFYSEKSNAITALESLKKTISQNTVSYNTTSVETEIKGVFGNTCTLKNGTPLPELIIDIEKEDKKFIVVTQITRTK